MSVNFLFALFSIAVCGFTIAMTFKQKSRVFIFGGSAGISFVLGTIFGGDMSHGVLLAVASPILSFLTQYALKSFKKGAEDGKDLRETFKGILSEVSGFNDKPAEFVEKYNSEVDDYVEMATQPEEGSHRKRKQVDCSALKIVKTVEQTPDSGYFQLKDAPYIKIHWIKGQYDERLKGVAFAMKTVRYLEANLDDATIVPKFRYGKEEDETILILPEIRYGEEDDETIPIFPEIRYGEEEDETIPFLFTVIKSMIHALYGYSRSGSMLRMAVFTLAKRDVNVEELDWTKVWKFQCEINEYAAKAFFKVEAENAERSLAAIKTAEAEHENVDRYLAAAKAAQENSGTLLAELEEKIFQEEKREEFEFKGVSFVVIASNQRSFKESKSNLWIVASKDAEIERRLESKITGR